MTYPDAAAVPSARRPRHVQCPTCRRGVRAGWSGGSRVVGQHWPPAQLLDGPVTGAACCPCPGSWAPVAEGDTWDFLLTPALTATGTLYVVPPADGAA